MKSQATDLRCFIGKLIALIVLLWVFLQFLQVKQKFCCYILFRLNKLDQVKKNHGGW